MSGTKPANPTDWSRQVIDDKQIFVANDIDGIAAVFSDHELIRSLGCESVINVPIVVAGEVLGTINCLHEAGFYTSEKVEAAEALKLPGAVCLLLSERKARTLMANRTIRAATDVGGTFTDLVYFATDTATGRQAIVTAKSDTTPPDFERACSTCSRRAASTLDGRRLPRARHDAS